MRLMYPIVLLLLAATTLQLSAQGDTITPNPAAVQAIGSFFLVPIHALTPWTPRSRA